MGLAWIPRFRVWGQTPGNVVCKPWVLRDLAFWSLGRKRLEMLSVNPWVLRKSRVSESGAKRLLMSSANPWVLRESRVLECRPAWDPCGCLGCIGRCSAATASNPSPSHTHAQCVNSLPGNCANVFHKPRFNEVLSSCNQELKGWHLFESMAGGGGVGMLPQKTCWNDRRKCHFLDEVLGVRFWKSRSWNKLRWTRNIGGSAETSCHPLCAAQMWLPHGFVDSEHVARCACTARQSAYSAVSWLQLQNTRNGGRACLLSPTFLQWQPRIVGYMMQIRARILESSVNVLLTNNTAFFLFCGECMLNASG